MKRVYLVRHGETSGNSAGTFQVDSTPLTELGHTQAQAVAERLKALSIDVVVASPFLRAQQTAQHISTALGLNIETFHDFHECLQPLHLRGKSKLEGEGLEFRNKYFEYYVQDELFAEGFENFNLVSARTKACTKFLEAHPGTNIAVVSHGAFIPALAAYLLLQKKVEMEVAITIANSLEYMSNTAVTEFTFTNDKWELAKWNDKAHFAE